LKLFISKLSIFLLIAIFPLALVEIYVRNIENTFKLKSNHFISNLKNIEVLFLGSSHAQTAVNPEYITLKSANLAYGMQDLQLDSMFFFNYIDRLEQIKVLVLEVDYHSLDLRNNNDYFRFPWYDIYYEKITNKKYSWYKKIFLYLSAPEFFNNLIYNELAGVNAKYRMNKYGCPTIDSVGLFYDLNYNDSLIYETINVEKVKKHSAISQSNFDKNSNIVNQIIDDCMARGIKVMMMEYPKHQTYLNGQIKLKNDKRINLIKNITEHNNDVKYFNFSAYKSDEAIFFTNEDHLNATGSQKFSSMLNLEIAKVLQ